MLTCMELEIKYCLMCGGQTQADEVAGEIKKFLGLPVVLTDVGKGKFEVLVNGTVIFSKQKEGRFPRDGEIIKLCRHKFQK